MSHLNLLQDLLSLTELPDELYTTLAQQIALLPLPALQQLLNISLCSSPALDSARLNLSTAVKFYTATRRGLQTRILRLLSEQHSHWTNRRRLSALYEALHDTVAEAPASNDILKPILSASLKSSIAIKDAPFISDGLRDKCDQWMIESWKNYLGVVQVEHHGIVAWLVSSSLVDMPVSRLALLQKAPLLDVLHESITEGLGAGLFLEGEDIQKRVAEIKQSSAHAYLGSHSRLFGKLLEASSRSEISGVEHAVVQLETLTKQIHTSAASKSTWRTSSTSAELSPWLILKAALFSTTMILASLLRFLAIHPCDKEDVANLCSMALRIFGNLYFVTKGQSGFLTYRATWSGLVKTLRNLGGKYAEVYLVRSKPDGKREVWDTDIEYWMLGAEAMGGELSEEVLETLVLPTINEHILDERSQEVFASSHSLVLALLRGKSSASTKIIPWYIDVLLLNHGRFHLNQLTAAYSQAVLSASEADEALAWWCIEKLIHTIRGTTSPLDPPEVDAQNRLTAVLISQCSVIAMPLLQKLMEEISKLLDELQASELESLFFSTVVGEAETYRKEVLYRFWLARREE